MGEKTREPGNEVDKLKETLPTVRAPLRSHTGTSIDSESYVKSLAFERAHSGRRARAGGNLQNLQGSLALNLITDQT